MIAATARQWLPSPRLAGFLCILLSAAGFGALPIFAKIAYANGVSLPSMLFLRFALAAALMTFIMHLHAQSWPRGRTLFLLLAMGGLAYVGQAFCYFAALQYATAGLTALLLYLYPALVTVLSALLARRRLPLLRLLAVGASLLGCALAVGGSLDGQLAGILLGIGAALIYSVYILVGERVTQAAGAIPASSVVMLSAALVYGVVMLWNDAALPASLQAWMAVACIALFSTVVAIVAFFAGMARLGAADAASLSTLEPVFTILLAALFLGEAIGVMQLAGGAIILAAVVVLARPGGRSKVPEQA